MKKINTALPSSINYESVSQLINLLDSESEDLQVTWNSAGGLTGAGQVLMAYLNDTDKNVHADVAGLAASMGAFLLPFFKTVKGANQADIMIHSVAGGEESTHNHTNKLLYDSWAKKIDLERFKEVTGKTLKEVLFNNNRIDVWITGKDAKYIKLFDESYNLVNKAASLVESFDIDKLDFELPETIKNKYFKKAEIVKSNINSMEIKDVTASLLQSGNKDVYENIFNAGKKAEQERVAKIMKYAEYDMEKATEMIQKGATLEIEDVEHFIEKKHDKAKVAELEDNSEKEVIPGKKVVEPVKKEAEIELKNEKSAILESIGFEIKEK